MLITERPTLLAFHNILFATDFSGASRRALPYARAFAERFNATLFFANAVPPMPLVIPPEPILDQTDILVRGAEREMQTLTDSASLDKVPHQTIVMNGEAWDVVRQIVADKRIDLVVLGTRGRGVMPKLIAGSVAEEILRSVNCPVLTIGPAVDVQQADSASWRVVFATDFSEGSLHALPYAKMLAHQERSKISYVHIIGSHSSLSGEAGRSVLSESASRLRKLADEGESADYVVDFGSAGPEIVRIASALKANLLVMGVHAGRHASSHLPWTVASHVLAHAPCPVLTVRGNR